MQNELPVHLDPREPVQATREVLHNPHGAVVVVLETVEYRGGLTEYRLHRKMRLQQREPGRADPISPT